MMYIPSTCMYCCGNAYGVGNAPSVYYRIVL